MIDMDDYFNDEIFTFVQFEDMSFRVEKGSKAHFWLLNAIKKVGPIEEYYKKHHKFSVEVYNYFKAKDLNMRDELSKYSSFKKEEALDESECEIIHLGVKSIGSGK